VVIEKQRLVLVGNDPQAVTMAKITERLASNVFWGANLSLKLSLDGQFAVDP
jgi:hypothetical protein